MNLIMLMNTDKKGTTFNIHCYCLLRIIARHQITIIARSELLDIKRCQLHVISLNFPLLAINAWTVRKWNIISALLHVQCQNIYLLFVHIAAWTHK